MLVSIDFSGLSTLSLETGDWRADARDGVANSYLTLDRQSRTLFGGEVQRINLTTALSTQRLVSPHIILIRGCSKKLNFFGV